ncbi:MAG: amino acid permease [Bacteroidetes bacterium]|nr:amino acid permease [Bacteroidota bacterium]
MSATRKLGLFDSTLLVSGSMIGSGIFLVTSDMTRQLGSGPLVLLAWLLTGVITLMAALSFGELASMMPNAGGQYNFVTRIYGKRMGFVYGWAVFSVIQTGVIAAVAMAFAKHLGIFTWNHEKVVFSFELFGTTFKLLAGQLIAIGSIFLLTLINSLGIQEGKWIQRIFTLAKLIALSALIMGGLYVLFGGSLNGVKNYFWENMSSGASHFVSPDDLNPLKSNVETVGGAQLHEVIPQWQSLAGIGLLLAFASAMVGSLFSSDAWQGITFMSGEVENPSKTIPKALLYGTFIVTVVYCLANVAYMAVLPLKGLDLTDAMATVGPNGLVDNLVLGISHADQDRVGVAASSVLMGSAQNAEAGLMGLIFMATLIIVSTFGCNNGLILAGSRLYKAMADHGLFFKSAAKLNRKNVPANALWMQAFWASALCLSGTYGDLLSYCTFASLLFYIITVAGVLILRKREPEAERPYKVWCYPYLPIIYLIVAGFVALGIIVSQFSIAITGIGIVALGWPIYSIFSRRNQST